MTPNHFGSLQDAVKASQEEDQLEAVVSVTGGETAQRAVRTHTLPNLIDEVNGHA